MFRRAKNNEEKPDHFHIRDHVLPQCRETEGEGCDKHCPQYKWWCDQQSKTVRVTQGAFTGLVGRLSASWFNMGTVTYRAGGVSAKAYDIKIVYDDLEVVNEDGPNYQWCNYHGTRCRH